MFYFSLQNLPYILFFVSKNWYVFFRQFHILCERLSRLLHESTRTDIPSPVKIESDVNEEQVVGNCMCIYFFEL